MSDEGSAENGRPDQTPWQVDSVEVLVEVSLQDYLTDWDEQLAQRESVMDLWNAARQDDEAGELAIWGLGEIAKDRSDGIGSLAHDRLDRLSKEMPEGSEPWKRARETLREVLKARDA